ncbi:hypothetical protein ACE939_00945 [Aquimarina sp. W85]|uniref:hypothetical protein n=1 Tax=Aquimarina rhodophyticola TaxID=3342246 RepID=UPI00366C3A30
MKALRILYKGSEIEFVREDLKFKSINNSFKKEFFVMHNTYPIRIVENKNTVNLLGPLKISTSKKKKIIPVEVSIGTTIYTAELIQNKAIEGFRKCDIRFGSVIYQIKDRKIASYFRDYNVLGNSPLLQEYKEESDKEYGAMNAWINEARNRENKIYPEIDWQLPRISYRDRLKEEQYFLKFINNRNVSNGNILKNSYSDSYSYLEVKNKNVIAPHVFLLAPLLKIFNSLGYKISGSFPNDPMIKRILVVPKNDNLTKVPVSIGKKEYTQLSPLNNDYLRPGPGGNSNNIFENAYYTYIYKYHIIPNVEGNFKLFYDFEMRGLNGSNYFFGLRVYIDDELIDEWYGSNPGRYKGELEYSIEMGQKFSYAYHNIANQQPLSYSLYVVKEEDTKDLYDFHPTIDFSRYLPDWTVIEYLTKLKNDFCLNIEFDEVKKELRVNYNRDYLKTGNYTKIGGVGDLSEFTNIEYDSYSVRHADRVSPNVFIDHNGTSVNRAVKKTTDDIITSFKTFSFLNGTASINENSNELDGVGLVLYDPVSGPNTINSYSGRHLRINGAGGLFDINFHDWIKFKLNSGVLKLKKTYSSIELDNILKTRKVYHQNQMFLVGLIKYEDKSSGLIEAEMDLHSVNY